MTESKAILRPKVFLVCSILPILVGASTLLDWYIHSPRLIQIHESWAPMQFNTALSFFFCGLAGIFILNSQGKIGRLCALIPILFGSLTLIEYLFSIDLSIDEMFMSQNIMTKTSHAGRMAPNTSLCFLLTGMALELIGFSLKNNQPKLNTISFTIGLLVISLSLLAIIGYAVGLEVLYGWGHLIRMAIHTSICFFILGIALASNSIAYKKFEKNVIFFSIIFLFSLAIVVSVLALMEIKAQNDTKRTLETSLARTINELNLWANDVERDTLTFSKSPRVLECIEKLLKVPQNAESLLAHPCNQKLDDLLRPIIIKYEYIGFIVVSPDNLNLASMLKVNVGDKNVLSGQTSYLDHAFNGKWALSLPVKAELPLENIFGKKREGSPTMFSLAPVFNNEGQQIAVLIFRLDPFKKFTRMFQLATFGETGETYAFNEKGQFISGSRFNRQLVKLGLIQQGSSAILNLEIRDPGGDMTDGFRPSVPINKLPFTLLVESALRGESKTDLVGYRDYRGVAVVGSWVWLESLGLGIAAEINLEEMYTSYYYLRYSVFFLLLAMLTLFSISSVQLKKRRELLIESDQRLNMALTASNAGVWDWNIPTGKVVFSSQWLESLGYDENEFAGTIENWENLIHPEDKPVVTEALNN